MGAFRNSNAEQNFKGFDNFPISMDEVSICISSPLVGSNLTQPNGFNGGHQMEPGLTRSDGFSGSQQVSMIPAGVPLQGINTPCYNIPPFTPPVTEQPSVLGFDPRPPLYQGAVEGQQGPFYQAAGPEYIDPHQLMQQTQYSGNGVFVSEMGEPSNGGGGGGGEDVMKKKKKAIRWSKEEHRLFLIGMKIHKKGDWKSISRYLVPTRSSTQVASHAQKYFSKENSQPVTGIKKKRTSIHDVRHDDDDIVDDPVEIDKLQQSIEQQHQQRRTMMNISN